MMYTESSVVVALISQFSSFESYETYDNLKVDYSTDKTFAGKGFRFQFEISGSKPLALSYIQKTKRDNPEEDLEQ